MIKQITIIALLLAYMAQTYSKIFIVFDYYLNTPSFAKNCENKAKPQLHCNGKCQMMKKIKQEENKENKNPERKGENKNEIIPSLLSFPTITSPVFQTGTILFSTVNDMRVINMPRSFFHPPGV